MIEPCNKNIRWLEKADLSMSLLSMLDVLYAGELIESYEEEHQHLQPYFHYEEVYEKHKDLMNDIVGIVCSLKVITPKNINVKSTDEYHLFIILNSIFYLEWFYKIEATRTKGYEKEKKKYDNARQLLKQYSSGAIAHEFPPHKTEILNNLQEYLGGINRPQQRLKIIKAIKQHFKIDAINQTKDEAIIKANKKIANFLKEEGLAYTISTTNETLKEDVLKLYKEYDKNNKI